MKRSVLACAVIAVLLTACAASRKNASPENGLDGKWVLAVFLPSQKKTLSEVFGERVVEVQLDTGAKSVAGTTGCNRFSGTFKANSVQLTFSQNRVLTRMACPGYDEQHFLKTLNRVNRYRLVESELELLEDSLIVMIFAKKPQ